MAVNESSVWQDITGAQRITLIRANLSGGGIQSQMAAISAAGLWQYWQGTLFSPSTAPTAGNVYTGGDLAIFNFSCADGTEASIRVPAPLSTIFLADGRTVDPAGLAAPLITACIGELVSETGSLAVAYLSGYRKSRAP